MTTEEMMTIIILEFRKYAAVRSMRQVGNVITIFFTDGTEKTITVG